jgi:GAF domain-containing protein
VIYLRAAERAALVPVAAHHDDPGSAARFEEFLGAASSWSGRRLLAALDAGASVLVSGSARSVADWLGAPEWEMSSLLAVPVPEPAGGVLGAIAVIRGGGRYDAGARDALGELAATLAGALDRERLAWELRERLEAESRTARALYLADQRFTAAFHDSPVALALFNFGPGESVLLDVNYRLAALLGTTVDALRQHTSPSAFVHPDDLGQGRRRCASCWPARPTWCGSSSASCRPAARRSCARSRSRSCTMTARSRSAPCARWSM